MTEVRGNGDNGRKKGKSQVKEHVNGPTDKDNRGWGELKVGGGWWVGQGRVMGEMGIAVIEHYKK